MLNFSKPSTLFETCECCGNVTSTKPRIYIINAIIHHYQMLRTMEIRGIEMNFPKAIDQLKKDAEKYNLTDEEQLFVITQHL